MGDQVRAFMGRFTAEKAHVRTGADCKDVSQNRATTGMESMERLSAAVVKLAREPNTRQTIPRRHRHAAGMPDQGKLALRAVGYEGIYHLPVAGAIDAEAGQSVVLL
jgi:hypothetical protein